MLGRAEASPIKERSTGIPFLHELLVFSGRQRPENELNEAQLTQFLIEQRKKQIEEALPHDVASLQSYKEQFGEALKYSLMAEYPARPQLVTGTPDVTNAGDVITKRFTVSRPDHGDLVQMTIREQEKPLLKPVVLVLSAADILEAEEGAKAKRDRDSLINSLIQSGHTAATINYFPAHQAAAASKYKFFTTYNRTDAANRIQDILTAISILHSRNEKGLSVVALDKAGVLALLARGLAPQLDRMLIDASQLDVSSDEEFLKWLPIPGIRRAGDFVTAVAIAPLTPLRVHNTGDKFQTARIAEIYRRLGRAQDFQSQQKALSNAEIITWLSAKRP
ncbi:MAG: hypothetical protein ABIP14_08965 [Blastocatellia bacterium]